jgi:hypothetical protein
MRMRWIGAALVACAIGGVAWAQEKKAAEAMETQVRRAGFQYYVTTLLGAADEHLKVARMPVTVIRDGVISSRDATATRALLAGFTERLKASKTPDEDKQAIVKAVIPIFDEASIQFIGANTASLTFLVRRGKTEKDGEYLAMLTLFRKDGDWKVISETTDSAAVPPEYLK